MCNLAEGFKVELRRQSNSPKFITSFLMFSTKVWPLCDAQSEVEFDIISEKFNLCRTKIISI